jgi:acyl dehydratase
LTFHKNEVKLNNVSYNEFEAPPMLNSSEIEPVFRHLEPGANIGVSPWVVVTQAMIDGFGEITLDPDPMHVDPEWARVNSPFEGTVAFGFLTLSLLTHLLHMAIDGSVQHDPKNTGYYLNYGFDRLRFVSPVRCGRSIRGRFEMFDRKSDERQRLVMTLNCTVEIEGEDRPALSAHWLTVWVPPLAKE